MAGVRIRCRILSVTANETEHQVLADFLLPDPHIVLEHACSAEEVLRKLNHRDEHEMPNLIVMRARLLAGLELLKKFKQDARLQPIPVIIITSSAPPAEVDELYRVGASCVITDAGDRQTFKGALSAFKAFWIQSATLPYCSSLPVKSEQKR